MPVSKIPRGHGPRLFRPFTAAVCARQLKIIHRGHRYAGLAHPQPQFCYTTSTEDSVRVPYDASWLLCQLTPG
jgi:hypothetical protein